MGPSDNRLTQINMVALARAESLTEATQRAVLHRSLGYSSTSKNEALSKKSACFLEDALDATTRTRKAQ
jgi:hypothetical protein